jgi:hypothetical protein
MANEKQQAKIIFQETPGRQNLPISGAWGGLSPNGQGVVAHVYSEYQTIPSLQTADVGPDGSVNMDEAQMIRRGDVVREVVATLHMAPETAISFGQWLIEKGQSGLEFRART